MQNAQLEELSLQNYQTERRKTENLQIRDCSIEDFQNVRKSHKTLNDECTNFNELSSIYENTEEEMCTPDRELKFEYSTFNEYK